MGKFPQSYMNFERTTLYKHLDKILLALEKNQDIQLRTRRAYVLGYICKALTKPGRARMRPS